MSKPIKPFNAANAAKFNAANAKKLGWYEKLPVEVFADFDKLRADALGATVEREAFAGGVLAYQNKNGLLADGMLGRQTWIDLVRRYDNVDEIEPYFVFKGRRITATAEGFKFWAFDAPGGYDLHPSGDFTSFKRLPKRKITKIVLHWGGVDAKSCRNALTNADLSSHFGVEAKVAYQWLDLAHRGWHAGFANTDSIGIDICQQPTVKFLNHYQELGKDVRVVDNPARRPDGRVVGDRKVLTLDSVTASTTLALCRSLCRAFDIPFGVPRDDDGKISHEIMSKREFTAFSGVLWHGNVSASKWDVNPWAAQIFEPGFEY